MTKRNYMSENIMIYKQMMKELNSIQKILPEIYDGDILFDLYSLYFPHTIRMLTEKYENYKSKDLFLESVGKKVRYNPLNAKDFFFSSQKVKYILSNNQKRKHKQEFNEELKLFFIQ